MSLQFSQDPLSKREKQDMFKRSLDDQRRMKEEASLGSGRQGSSRDPSSGQHVSGLHGVVPGFDRIPGLDDHQRGGGYAPRFEGSPSPQEKQPYMSALSEMNGRPLHVRQQQFQKESEYRNMLRTQIEENKKRKDAEKAKLEEEKKRELEEIQRLQGRPAPRRQQHAQFQESPDHPLPSPGRLPPARQLDQHRDSALQDHDRGARAVPAYGVESDYRSRKPQAGSESNNAERWQGRQRAPTNSWDQERLGHGYGSYAEPPQRSAAEPPIDLGREGRLDVPAYAQYDAPPRNDGKGQAGWGGEAGRQGNQYAAAPSQPEEGTARKLAFERSIRGSARDGDMVPRADFDELSSLCRDLLEEQKHLRRKLEEREEREQLAERSRQSELQQRDQQTRHSRGNAYRGKVGSKAGGVATVVSGDARRRVPQLHAPQVQGSSTRERAPRRDVQAKPAVAFGSTVSRTGQPRKVDKPRGTVSRGARDPRVSKSEPVPRAEDLDFGQRRNTASTHSASGEHLLLNQDPSESGWANITKGSIGSRFAREDRALGGRALHKEGNSDRLGVHRSEMLGGSTIHALVGGNNRPQASSRDVDELGGESKFLSAHPPDFGVPEGALLGRDRTFLDPTAAADLWKARR